MAVRELNGIRITYDDIGEGPALVLVHGHPFDRSMWSPQTAEFASRCRVIVPDLRGYGATALLDRAGSADAAVHLDEPPAAALGPDGLAAGALGSGGSVGGALGSGGSVGGALGSGGSVGGGLGSGGLVDGALGPDGLAGAVSGSGESADAAVVPSKTLLSTFAADLLALVNALGIETFTLGGLSMGGQIVMECYRQFPTRITAMLLADTFPRPDDAAAREARRSAADRIEREGTAWYAAENLTKMITPHNAEALPAVASHVRNMMLSAPPQGAAAALRGRAERPDYRPLLRTVKVPTAVVVGADDSFTPVSDAEEMHALLPNATLTVIPGAAHLPNLERPEAFNAALHTFLDQIGRHRNGT